MKIPTQDLPRVSPGAPNAPTLRVEKPGGFDSLARGFGDAGHAADTIIATEKKEREKAIAADVTDAETEFTHGANEDMHGSSGSGDATKDAIDEAFNGTPSKQPGFLSTRGRAAAEQSIDTKERIAKRRKEIADNLNTDEAKELFLKRTGGQLEDYYRGIESHTSQQRQVADVATLNARREAALETVRANPNNLTAVERQAAALEGPIQALALSPEDAQADVRKWQGDVAAAQIDAQLQSGDWQSAETMLKSKGTVLSEKDRHTLTATVERVKEATQSETMASSIVKGALREDGSLDQRKAIAELDKVDPDIRDKVRPKALQLMTEAEQAYRAETERITTKATAGYAKSGWTKEWEAGIGEQLRVRNPERYLALRNANEAKWHRIQNDKKDGAAARREQAARDKEALNDFMSLSPEERANADIDEFLATRDVSPVGRSALGPRQAAAKEHVEKGQATHQGEFMKEAEANSVGFVKGEKAKKEFKAAASLAYDDFQREHKRPPNQEEAKKLIGSLVITTDTKPGFFYGTNPEKGYQRRIREQKEGKPATPPEAPQPEAKKVMKYLVSPDKKQRVPIYADGTKGSPEPVR